MNPHRPTIDGFVRSTACPLGVGKLTQFDRTTAAIDYFVGPGCPPVRESVSAESVRAVELACETRVYMRLGDGVSWRAGRALAKHHDNYLVRFPNEKDARLVPEGELYTRCDRPLPDPSVFLAARITETPLWQEGRGRFVRALIEQRGASAGMTALLSAGIDLEPHQIEVVRRVLQDPVQRYLLADEVGLGKTIEAGVVIRQYVLDRPHDHAVLVLVPGHLVRQWEGELEHRFRLGPLLGESVRVLPHGSPELDVAAPPGLLVVDEAHQVSRGVGTPAFGTVRRLAADPRVRLLLLSATPTLHSDAAGFQALLHLLDPAVYPLGDLAGFRERLAAHERVAQLYHQFRPDEVGSHLEGQLDQLLAAFPADARLSELAADLRPLLEYGADADDPRREGLIRRVRGHVSEVYRLHRRLLRNRRADDRVDRLLPGRVGLRRWEYDDQAHTRLAELLDEWRASASAEITDATKFGRILAVFVDALTAPEELTGLIDVRLGERPEHPPSVGRDTRRLLADTPAFDGETVLLGRLREAAEQADTSPRVAAVVAGLEAQFAAPKSKWTRAVVFATSPAVADELFDALRRRWPSQVLRHGQAGWQHYVTSPKQFRLLVCDGSAEEGLNLHGSGSMLVHFDLPSSPNRVEQRIGRLDRFGCGTPVLSAMPMAAGDVLAAAWADHLDRGYGVFERSVAALQYVIDAELTALGPRVLADGPAAVTAATDRLGGDDGVVATALQQIGVVDELDAVDAPPGHEQFSEQLRQTDDTRTPDWQAAVHTWARQMLQFAQRAEGEHNSGVWRYQFQRPDSSGSSTLMPVDRLVRQFAHVIDLDDERSSPRSPLTYPLTFSRVRAQRARVALARVGDSFVDALAEYVGWDDRGAVAALWRWRPGAAVGRPAEVAFRFEFVVECPTVAAVAELSADDLSAATAVRRQADWLFPPFHISVWLDENLEEVAESASNFAVLTEGYTKRHRDGGKDFNLNPTRWAAIEPHFPRDEWARLVGRARAEAEQVVRGSAEWGERLAERTAAATTEDADRAAQTASRLAHLTGADRQAEEAHSRTDAAVSEALLHGVANPAVRLDSVTAVFLADWNPFEGDDE